MRALGLFGAELEINFEWAPRTAWTSLSHWLWEGWERPIWTWSISKVMSQSCTNIDEHPACPRHQDTGCHALPGSRAGHKRGQVCKHTVRLTKHPAEASGHSTEQRRPVTTNTLGKQAGRRRKGNAAPTRCLPRAPAGPSPLAQAPWSLLDRGDGKCPLSAFRLQQPKLTQLASTAHLFCILPKLDAPFPEVDNAIRPRSTGDDTAPSVKGFAPRPPVQPSAQSPGPVAGRPENQVTTSAPSLWAHNS